MAETEIRRLQVVEALGEVKVGYLRAGFDLDQQDPVDEEIRSECSNKLLLVVHVDRPFGLDFNTEEFKLRRQGIAVDLLDEATTKGVGDLIGQTDDLAGQLIEAALISGIGVIGDKRVLDFIISQKLLEPSPTNVRTGSPRTWQVGQRLDGA